MANAGAGRHHAETAECLLSPFQEHITLMVTFHFQPHVFFKRIVIAEMIDRHRVVNNQINRR